MQLSRRLAILGNSPGGIPRFDASDSPPWIRPWPSWPSHNLHRGRSSPRVRCETGLMPGQHVIYTLTPALRILLRVLSIHEDKGGRGPRVALLEWTDVDGIPANPAALPGSPRPHARAAEEGEGMGFTLFGSPGDPVDRLQYVEPAQARRLLGVVTIKTRPAPRTEVDLGVGNLTGRILIDSLAVDGQVQFPDARA